MKIRYFSDTDTVYIELTENPVVDTQDLSDTTVVDLDAQGSVVAITIEHAHRSANIHEFSFERIPVPQTQLAAD
jgi:uncharacterized protein YuzE